MSDKILNDECFKGIEPFEKKVWLASPTMHGLEQEYINKAFRTNWVSTVGENIDELEKGICEYVGISHAAALSSGTAALHLAVKLAGVEEGDIVLCSDMTFAATVNPVSYEKGVQVFIDSERDTWNMDPRALERALKKYDGRVQTVETQCADGTTKCQEKLLRKPKAVIAANLYGTPAKLDEIAELCERYGVTLIEDAAESLSATYKGRQTGTFGKYNAISFNGNKLITTSGGGMLLSDDVKAIEKARFWSTQARDAAPWYEHSELGYNYRMSNILAGIGRGQLKHIDEHRERKKEIYERYKEGLQDLPVEMNPHLECSEPNYWLSCMTIDREYLGTGGDHFETDMKYAGSAEKAYIDRASGNDGRCVGNGQEYLGVQERQRPRRGGHRPLTDGCALRPMNNTINPNMIRQRLEEYNIESRPIWKPMHLQPYYRGRDYVTAEGEDVGGDIFTRGLCLPSDIKMTEAEQQVVIEVIKSCFTNP